MLPRSARLSRRRSTLTAIAATLLLGAACTAGTPADDELADAPLPAVDSAAAPPGAPPAPTPPMSADTIRVTGRITDEGVECPALRTDGDTLYTLAGAPDWVRPGERVAVTGTIAEMSFCMQGTTIAVQRVERRP